MNDDDGRLRRLMCGMETGTLNDPGHDELLRVLVEDDRAFEAYADDMLVQAGLSWLFAGRHESETHFEEEFAGSVRAGGDAAEDPDREVWEMVMSHALAERRRRELEDEASRLLTIQQAEDARRNRGHRPEDGMPLKRDIVIPRSLIYGGIAALLLIAAAVFLPSTEQPTTQPVAGNDHTQQPTQQPDVNPITVTAPVAVLVRTHRVRWSGVTPNADGSLVAVPMELTHGFAELELAGGARVIVQAPARFELIDGNRMALQSGRLVAQASGQAHGFAVQTPDALVVDLGTEFAVAVMDADEGPTTFSQVYQGKVQMASAADGRAAAAPDLLLAGEARQTEPGKDTLSVVKPKPHAFVRTEDLAELTEIDADPAKRRGWMRSLELAQRDDVVAYFDMSPDPDDPTRLVNRSWHGEAFITDGAIVNARPVRGREPGNQATGFGHGADASYITIQGRRQMHAITLAAWVKVDRHDKEFSALLNTDNYIEEAGGMHWQIYGRGVVEFTVATPDRVELQKGVFSSTRLLSPGDGSWHHIAVTFDTAAGVATHYFNGQQVGSGRIPASEPIDLSSARIGGWSQHEDGLTRQLHGAIDELLILNRALTEDEVQRLHKLGAESETSNRGASAVGARPSAGLSHKWANHMENINEPTPLLSNRDWNNG